MNAVCVQCGGYRKDYRSTCPGCGFRPDGDGLLVAWLLSEQALDAAQLAETARRIKAGEAIRPSERMLARARQALGITMAADPGLTSIQRLLLVLTSLLLTPIPGFILAIWWWKERPRAALQALFVAAPIALVTMGVWLVWLTIFTVR